MRTAPSSAPRTSPRPPKRLTPPMTADAIAFSSRFPGGNVSATEFTCAAKMMPPMPAVAPEIMKTRTRMRGDVDARSARRLGISSDRVDVTAERRPASRGTSAGSRRRRGSRLRAAGRATVVITFAWLEIPTMPNATIAIPTARRRSQARFTCAIVRAACGDRLVEDADRIERRDDRGDRPAGQWREEVAVGVVDPAVLDDDRPALLELVQDHALPDEEAARA